MAINSGGASVLTVQIVGNRIEAPAPRQSRRRTASRLIAPGTLDGYIDSNFVTGIAYDNTLASTKWVATSILNWNADVDVSNNIVTNGHVGVYNYDAQGAIAKYPHRHCQGWRLRLGHHRHRPALRGAFPR